MENLTNPAGQTADWDDAAWQHALGGGAAHSGHGPGHGPDLSKFSEPHLALPILGDSSVAKPSLARFVSRTLAWVALQLTVTCGVCVAMYARKDAVTRYLDDDKLVVWAPVVLLFVSLFAMYLTSPRSRGMRLGWFCVFTLSMSFVVGVSVMQYSPKVVLLAAGTTWAIVCGAAAYSRGLAERGKDLDHLGPVLGGILSIVLILGIANLFLRAPWLEIAVSAVSVILFSFYLAYDLCRLYSARDASDPMMEDGLLPAVEIYVDVINVFVNLLLVCSKLGGE
tara:strand:- start:262 stop:1104 length:843 start_codon:yes stop_codon:yes gene_type:complete